MLSSQHWEQHKRCHERASMAPGNLHYLQTKSDTGGRSIQAQQPQLLHQLQNEGRGSFNLSQKRVKAWALKLRPRVIRTEGGLVTDRESCFGGWEGGPGAGGTWPGSGRRGLRLSVGPLQAAGKQQSLEEKGART